MYNEDTLYIIQWRSPLSGGTKSELRRTERGKDNVLKTLQWLGISREDIIVLHQKKEWEPDGRQYNKRRKNVGRHEAAASSVHTGRRRRNTIKY